MENIDATEKEIKTALQYCNKIKRLNREYQQNHKEENRKRARDHFQMIKNDEEKYKVYLENKKKIYREKKSKQIDSV